MSKFVYCAQCGKKLSIFPKAMPKAGVIITLVESHECSDSFTEPELTPTQIPSFSPKRPKGKFSDRLEELQPSPEPFPTSEVGLRDRRDEKDTRSSAPDSIRRALFDKGD